MKTSPLIRPQFITGNSGRNLVIFFKICVARKEVVGVNTSFSVCHIKSINTAGQIRIPVFYLLLMNHIFRTKYTHTIAKKTTELKMHDKN